jgi:hypothetical protein
VTARVAHQGGEIADNQHSLMTEFLKIAQLSEYDCVSEMNIRTGWINSELYPKRPVFTQFFRQFGFADYLGGAAGEFGELFCWIHSDAQLRIGRAQRQRLFVFVQQLTDFLDRE